MTLVASNAKTLDQELNWFSAMLMARIEDRTKETITDIETDIQPPDLDPNDSIYGNFIHHYQMTIAERLLIVLVLTPHVRPELLDILFMLNTTNQRGFTEFGGVQGKLHSGFLPTGETAMFLLAGANLHARFEYLALFERDHFFAKHNIITLEPAPSGEPKLSGQLTISNEIVDYLTKGELNKPDFSQDFPAKLIETEMEWDDLVLPTTTREQLSELIMWMKHQQKLMEEWGLAKRLKPGYKTLFYGPPGTGKTLTATLLGKKLQRDVYRIALSSVVSKYIGETEKNLDKIFAAAEKMDCILFFDEADALFGKRTNVSDAHDRYANQEVSYLLQRIEDFPGVVILASNFSHNIDDAFMRRFQAVVYFPMPNKEERKRLWQGALSMLSHLEMKWDVTVLADRYELAGGSIMNVVRYAALVTMENEAKDLKFEDLVTGVRRELTKEGKTL
ncbi:ATP-binding protein [Aliiglaciecola sp. M165]|uniref:ATP-binding protein n=1 Tax=Aliiglaciecola sp. M165 TaxID=2593649 RepID=UPI00117D36F0|nr:ATP-binding protein [Aliiglaciecola sp. M165]TRY29845.1 ATP-binding protein [Aliiglaciecola sp. M165]